MNDALPKAANGEQRPPIQLTVTFLGDGNVGVYADDAATPEHCVDACTALLQFRHRLRQQRQALVQPVRGVIR